MTSKSKTKGSTFERDVAKFLSELYQESFCRVPYSGAFIGGRNVHRKKSLSENQITQFKGDIQGPDKWSLNIECKNYHDFSFHQLLTKCPLLDSWIKQLHTSANENDVSLLIFKISHKGQYVVTELSDVWDNTVSFCRYQNHTIFEFYNFFEKNKEKLKNLAKKG